MVKKSIKVSLEENESHSSVAKGLFETRVVLWAIVEAVKESVEEIEEVKLMQQVSESRGDDDDDEELPIKFCSKGDKVSSSLIGHANQSKKKGRKGRKRKLHETEEDSVAKLWRHYRNAVKTSHRIQEDNIFYISSAAWSTESHENPLTDATSTPQYHLVQIHGLAPPSNDLNADEILLVRFLQTYQFIYAYRSQLIPIHTTSRGSLLYTINTVYQCVDEDFWYRLKAFKPPSVHDKYWDQRYRIFEKFDEGILLDDESWYSITYECIGNYIADRCLQIAVDHNLPKIDCVIDGFSGCGGMTIPIARKGCHVVAVDIDENKLKYLK